jgi:stage V sporulation protein G
VKITDVKVLPVEGNERLKAFATMKIDGCFVVRDMKVINGNNGYFVAMPAKKMKDGTYKDLFHPLDQETRTIVEAEVLAEYKRVVSQGSAEKSL